MSMRKGLTKTVTGALVALMCVAADARAQQLPTFDLERLTLDPSGRGALTVGSAELMEPGSFRVGVATQYSRDPLRVREPISGDRFALVRNRVGLHVMGAWTPLERIEFAAELPVIAYQDGANLEAFGLPELRSTTLGSPRLTTRLALLHQGTMPLNIAAQVDVAVPVGFENALSREQGVAFTPRLLASRVVGETLFAFEAASLIRGRRTFGDQIVGNELEFAAAITSQRDGIRPEVSIRSAVPYANEPASVELLGAVRVPMGKLDEIFLAAGPSFGRTPGTPLYRLVAGIAYGAAPQAPLPAFVCDPALPHTPEQCPDLDDDKDGILNRTDKCPLEAEDKDGFEDEDGCPESDNDKDGIIDGDDRCPNEKGVPEYNGCPIPDKDADGVLDADDACPDVKGTKELKGCPDRDGDGVGDAVDRCPDEAGPADNRGCPIVDTDKDGVVDSVDNCPREPGPKENQGCPPKKKQLVIIRADKIEITQTVYFQTGKSKILPRSFGLLDQVADVLKDHPEIEKVKVEGHTDSTGSEQTNRRLSQERADSVKAFLISKGVAPERLESEGFGPDRPIDTNATAKGREKNRRVEFSIQNQQPAEGGR